MNVTLIGLVVAALSLFYSLRPYNLLAIILAASAFEAAAAASVGSYGLQPALLPTGALLVFFGLQISQGLRFRGSKMIGTAIFPFALVVIWALVSSMILPRVFAGKLMIWPLRPEAPFLQVPLAPNPSNLTQDFYIAIDLLCLAASSLLASRETADNKTTLRGWWLGGFIAAGIALWQFASLHAPIPFPDDLLHSNPSWAQLSSQELAGAARINGSFSEPAALSAFLIQFVFALGWTMLRGYRLGALTVLLPISVICILISTSTTGLVALVLFCVIVMGVAVFAWERTLRYRAAVAIAVAMLVGTPLAIGGSIFVPGIAKTVVDVATATLNKGESDSYRDRTSTDADSLAILVPSYGLGAGWGSNRSSSLIPGLLASLGIFGTAGLAVFALQIKRLVGRSLASKPRDDDTFCIEASLAGCVGVLVAASVSGPSLTAVFFYLLLGLALGSAARRIRNTSSSRVIT